MYLTSLTLQNFRCFDHLQIDELKRLAVLVGENDAGKTVLLDAISILVGSTACGETDFRVADGDTRAVEVEISGVFTLEEHDSLPSEYRVGEGFGQLHLRRRYSPTTAEVHVQMLGFTDPAFDNFSGADRQKELLARLGLRPATNEQGRKEQLADLVRDGRLVRDTQREAKLGSFALLQPHMPRIERIATNEYRSPDSVIQRTLQAAAARVIAPIDEVTGQPSEQEALIALRAQIIARLNEEIAQAADVLRNVHPRLRGLSVVPIIDFTRSVSATSLTANIGDGDRLLSSFGDGTKKRLWMGLVEWERQTARSNASGSAIRLYDEPDVNLHYHAQRQLFSTISELAADPALRVQCIVCTHAVTLIDRAPAESINVIQVQGDGRRSLSRFQGGDNPETLKFFNEVGRALGLSNTVLLYERAFLLVEGDSEFVALPRLYRTLFGKQMAEEGIVLVNLHSCSAWRSVLEVMLSNRLPLVQMLLDSDCQEEGSSAHVTPAALADLGYPPTFVTDHVIFVGSKEFEDAFPDSVIASALDEHFPRLDATAWLPHVSQLKQTAAKFSSDLVRMVQQACLPARRSDVSKPKLADIVACACFEEAHMPTDVVRALSKVRERAGN